MDVLQLTEENKQAIYEIFGIDEEFGFIVDRFSRKRLVCPFSKEEINANQLSILPSKKYTRNAVFINNYSYCISEYLTSELK